MVLRHRTDANVARLFSIVIATCALFPIFGPTWPLRCLGLLVATVLWGLIVVGWKAGTIELHPSSLQMYGRWRRPRVPIDQVARVSADHAQVGLYRRTIFRCDLEDGTSVEVPEYNGPPSALDPAVNAVVADILAMDERLQSLKHSRADARADGTVLSPAPGSPTSGAARPRREREDDDLLSPTDGHRQKGELDAQR